MAERRSRRARKPIINEEDEETKITVTKKQPKANKARTQSSMSGKTLFQGATTYPKGCNPIDPDMNLDELMKSLKLLANAFQNMNQTEDDTDTYEEYIPLALHLADERFLKHSSKDVRLLIACCIIDVLRIFAPTHPYNGEGQIEMILEFFVGQLEGLKRPQEAVFKRYFYLLESAVYTNCFVMCSELGSGQKIVHKLFDQIFKVVNMQHSGKVQAFMLNLLSPLLSSFDHFSEELLNCILSQIMEPLKSTKKDACSLAKELILSCSDSLESHLKSFFRMAVGCGIDKSKSKLLIYQNPYDLLQELYKIGPAFLPTVLMELEYGLHSTEVKERLSCVTVLGQVFSDKLSRHVVSDSPLWTGFLGRFKDADVKVRLKCVQFAAELVNQNPEARNDLTEELKKRIRDIDENVRLEAVRSIVAITKHHPFSLADNEMLLELLKERVNDKKTRIRFEALKGLASVYKQHLSEPDSSSASTKIATWIKNKILCIYYMTSIEDKCHVERVLNSCLVPYQLQRRDRMLKLLYLFLTLDEYAVKAFTEIQKTVKANRKQVAELLKCVKTYGGNDDGSRNSKLNRIVSTLSRQFAEPGKAIKFLYKFCADLRRDKTILKAVESLANPETDCQKCAASINTVLKELGGSASKPYYNMMKNLLERCSSVLVDKEAIGELVKLLLDVATKGALDELHTDLSAVEVLERGTRLISILACSLPLHFLDEEILENLLRLVICGETIALQTMKALNVIGAESQPIGETFPSIMRNITKNSVAMIKKPNPKLGKVAVKCLFTNSTDEAKKTVFQSIVTHLKSNLQVYHPNCRTAIVALGKIAELMVDEFQHELKQCISRSIIKDIITNPQRSEDDVSESEAEWCEEEDLPLITQCMILGLKCVTNWTIGLKNNWEIGIRVYTMLFTFLKTSGTFVRAHQEFPLSTAEQSWLRLTAGCCFLKLFAQKDIGDRYTVSEFCDLSCLMTDPVLEVRSRFARKLHKGLSFGFPARSLPLDFMGFYALGGFEEDANQRAILKRFLQSDIAQRRNCINLMTAQTSADTNDPELASKLRSILPDYAFVFAIPVLTNHPKFTSYGNLDDLRRIESCLWFILEPLIVRNEHYSFGFYKTLLDKIKNHTTGLDIVEQNNKMYAICDLAHGLISAKGHNFDMNHPAGRILLPLMYFKPHETGWTNTRSYLPPNLKVGTPSTTRGRKRINSGSAEKQKKTPVRKRKRNSDSAAADESSDYTAGTSVEVKLAESSVIEDLNTKDEDEGEE